MTSRNHFYKTILFILLLIIAAHVISFFIMNVSGETSTFINYQTLVTMALSFSGLWFNKLIRFPAPLQRNSKVTEYLKSLLLGSILGASAYVINAIFRFDSMLNGVSGKFSQVEWLLISIRAGIHKELWVRLFLLSLLVLLIRKLFRKSIKANWDVHISIIITGLFFGLIHVPNLYAFYENPTLLLYLFVFVLNGTAAVLFSLLYWKRGIEHAILAHISTDIVLKVILPYI